MNKTNGIKDNHVTRRRYYVRYMENRLKRLEQKNELYSRILDTTCQHRDIVNDMIADYRAKLAIFKGEKASNMRVLRND